MRRDLYCLACARKAEYDPLGFIMACRCGRKMFSTEQPETDYAAWDAGMKRQQVQILEAIYALESPR